MAQIRLSKFLGIFPKIPELGLPPNGATIAENCDFAYGELRSMKEPVLLKTIGEAVRSAFSEDGLRFYTWPVDTDFEISPFGSGADSDRLYFTSGSGLRMTSRSGASVNGGQPASSYLVGVPKPTVAPSITIDNGAVSADLETLTPFATFHYEYKGIKYQEQMVTLATVTNGKKYTFTALNRIVNPLYGAQRAAKLNEVGYDPMSTILADPTPKEAVPVIRLIFTTPLTGGSSNQAKGEIKLDQYSSNSSFAKPSGVSITLTQDAANAQNFTVTLEDSVIKSESVITSAYCYTCVNIYNEEGVPSPFLTVNSSSISKRTIEVTIPPIGQYAPLKEIRVYRTADGGASDEYFYSFSIPAIGISGKVSGVDTTPAGRLNETLKSNFYYPPPLNLKGLRNIGNGIFSAWAGNQLWFSDPYKPWSWPPTYVKTFGWPIAGMEVQGNGVVVTTLGNPSFVFGVSPDAMTDEKINVDQAGVSKWAIASVAGRILYASNDGIVTINGGSGSLAESQVFFTREVWRDKYRDHLATMQFSEYDGALIVTSRENGFTPFLIRLDEGEWAMSELPGLTANCISYLVTTDGLYFGNGNQLYQFSGGLPKTLTWQSKLFQFPNYECFSITSAIADGEFTIHFYADDVLRHTEQISANQPRKTFRLPSGFLAEMWKIKITGKGRFKLLHIANSPDELGGQANG